MEDNIKNTKIVPIILNHVIIKENMINRNIQDNELYKSLSKYNVFSLNIQIDADTEEILYDKISEIIDEITSGMMKYVNKIIITSNLEVINCVFRVIVDKYHESDVNNDNSPIQTILKIFHIDKTTLDLYRYLNELKILSGHVKFNKIPKISDLISHLDNPKTSINILTNYIKIPQRFVNQLTSLEYQTRCDLFDMLSCSSDIPEFVNDVRLCDIEFHTQRDVSRLFKVKFEKLTVRLVVYGIDENLQDLQKNIFNDIKSLCVTILNTNPLTNDFIIRKIKLDILYRDMNDDIMKIDLSNISFSIADNDVEVTVNYIDIYDVEDNDEIKRITEYIANIDPRMVKIMDIDAIRWWYSLFKYQNNTSYNAITEDIIAVINLNRLNSNNVGGKTNKKRLGYDISLQNVITDIITDKKQNYESIRLLHDIFAIGTKRVMLYYMLLYNYIGTYKPWVNIRPFLANTNHLNPSSNKYYDISKINIVNPNIQLLEHILHFSDLVMTKLGKINVSVEKTRVLGEIAIIKDPDDVFETRIRDILERLYNVTIYDTDKIDESVSFQSYKGIIFWKLNTNINANNNLIQTIVQSIRYMSNIITIFITNDMHKLDIQQQNTLSDTMTSIISITTQFNNFNTSNILSKKNNVFLFPEIRDEYNTFGSSYKGIDRLDKYTKQNDENNIDNNTQDSINMQNNIYKNNTNDLLIILDDNLLSKLSIDIIRYIFDIGTTQGLSIKICRITTMTPSNNDVNKNINYMRQFIQMKEDTISVIQKEDIYAYDKILEMVDTSYAIITNYHNIILYAACRYKPVLSISGICKLDESYGMSIIRLEDPPYDQKLKKRIRVLMNELKQDLISVRYMDILMNAYHMYANTSWETLGNDITNIINA